MKRSGFIAGLFAIIPTAALADRQADKRAFLRKCDESISLERLAGAPNKFIGKKVDLHGIVGPPMQDTSVFNLNSPENPSIFVVVLGDARNLERGQAVRVLADVQKPISGADNSGGSGTYAVLRARFIA